MKCFTIQSGDEFAGDVSRIITDSYWVGPEIHTVCSIDEAKHYKAKAAPNNWLKKAISEAGRRKDRLDDRIKSIEPASYAYGRTDKSLKAAIKILKWVENASVIELDIEDPNFREKKFKLNWRSKDHSSNMQVNTVSHSRYCCKACGLILRNIPYYEVYNGNPTKICIVCLKMRTKSIDAAYEALPKEFREAVETEILVSSI